MRKHKYKLDKDETKSEEFQRFSVRTGRQASRTAVQIDSIDLPLRNGLWNALHKHYFGEMGIPQSYHSWLNSLGRQLIQNLWENHFKWSVDTIAYSLSGIYNILRDYFFKCEWFDVYDFIEFIANTYEDRDTNLAFMESCNSILRREMSAFRFVGGIITQITDQAEIAEIEEAAEKVADHVKVHLNRALELLSDRKNPDYRNSIKESISAVEAICNLISGRSDATLGQALDAISISGKVRLHGALKRALGSLYGYASSSEGIRHALLDEEDLDFEDAKFMLVSCSAFINYMTVKSDKAGINISDERRNVRNAS